MSVLAAATSTRDPGFWNATVIAAMIAAAAALAVTIVDRLLNYRSAQRDARRASYARFLAGARMAGYYAHPANRNDPKGIETGGAFATALGEVELVGGPKVREAANALLKALQNKSAENDPSKIASLDDEIHARRDEFIEIAREDPRR